MTTKTNRGTPIGVLAILGGLLLSLLINHHSYLTDFNLVPGDRGDTRLLVFTLEHWFNVFRGQESFFALHLFHPDPHALGYNDAWFLFALPYSITRALGADYFTSYQLLLPLLTVVGYLAWVKVLRKPLGMDLGFAVLGAVLLTSLNSLQMQADHGKFSAINLFPVFIFLLYNLHNPGSKAGWRAALCLACFAGVLGLLFFTSYYPAWFFLFTLALFGLICLSASVIAEGVRPPFQRIIGFVGVHRWSLLSGIVVFCVTLVPFAITYSPLVLSRSVRGFDLVLQFSPTLRDIINMSALNYVWSPVLRSMGFEFGNLEAQMGSPLLVLLVFLMTAISLMVRVRRSGWVQASAKDRFLLLLSVTAAILVVMSLKFDGLSLWYIVYRFVPGASALRALGRILMMVDMIAIVVAVCGLQALFRWMNQRGLCNAGYVNAVFAILAAMLIAEQVNGMTFRLDKAGQLAFIERYQAPEINCTAFFINNAESTDLPFGYYHLDAMMISMNLGIPTVNGYSGFEPHQAFTLVPRGTEYKYRILDWLRLQKATRYL
jgi:hypothetical protein